MKHLLTLKDYSGEEILSILNLADQLKFEQKNNIEHKHLAGKTLAMIFAKSSTRTRVSFEVGMSQLGGNALFLSSSDIQLGRGEPICDTARVLSRYVDGIMIRTFKQSDVEGLAEHGSIPVINGLTDDFHPCQILADLMTIREFKGSLKNLKLCFVGDGNNVANSLIIGCIKVGISVAIACPKGYEPAAEVVAWGNATGMLTVTDDIAAAVSGSDIIYTDVWASMGQESESAKRIKDFAGYCVNDKLMSIANKDAMVLHCLPAHREEEISESVLEAHADEIFTQAENRMHAQKAVMVKLMA